MGIFTSKDTVTIQYQIDGLGMRTQKVPAADAERALRELQRSDLCREARVQR